MKVRFLLEEEAATYCKILPGLIPWAEEPGGLQSLGSREQLSTHAQASYPRKCSPDFSISNIEKAPDVKKKKKLGGVGWGWGCNGPNTILGFT